MTVLGTRICQIGKLVFFFYQFSLIYFSLSYRWNIGTIFIYHKNWFILRNIHFLRFTSFMRLIRCRYHITFYFLFLCPTISIFFKHWIFRQQRYKKEFLPFPILQKVNKISAFSLLLEFVIWVHKFPYRANTVKI